MSSISSDESSGNYSEEERSLFLGDLSCFCQEQDVYQFFQGCGEIESIRLMRSKTTNKCLGYGFITFLDINVLPIAMRLYGSVLLGRRVKIGLANPRKTSPVSAKIAALMKEIDRSRLKTKDSNSTTAQVHFSYLTQQTRLLITEETIRNIFSQFGEVDDVTIKKSCLDAHSQHGYGFVHFYLNDAGVEAAIRATSAIRQIVLDGVLYDSCLTRSLEAVLQPSPPSARPEKARRNSPPQFSSYERNLPPRAPASASFTPQFNPHAEKAQFSTYFQSASPPAPVRESYDYARPAQVMQAQNYQQYQQQPVARASPSSISEDFSFFSGSSVVSKSSSFDGGNNNHLLESSFDGLRYNVNQQPQQQQQSWNMPSNKQQQQFLPFQFSNFEESSSSVLHPFTH